MTSDDNHPLLDSIGDKELHKELSEELHELGVIHAERSLSIGEILERLGPRASALLVIICALPFSTPVSIPGLSTPFGLVILFLAARVFLGLPPWLPQRLHRIVLPSTFFAKVLSASRKLIGWLERRLQQGRLEKLTDREWKLRLHAGIVMLAAMLLILPLPPLPPFTNTLPALVSVIMTLSILKRDGAGVIAGYGVFLFTIGYFVFWGAVVIETFNKYGTKVWAFIQGMIS
jgi:hypothetical protein